MLIPIRCAAKDNKEAQYVADFLVCHDSVQSYIEDGGLKPDFFLWMEDDVILMENFFATLQSALSFQKEKLYKNPWLDIKLYLTPRLRGYAWDVIPILELVSTSALISTLLELFISRKLKILAIRYFVLLVLVHLTLLAISRYSIHFNKLYHNQEGYVEELTKFSQCLNAKTGFATF